MEVVLEHAQLQSTVSAAEMDTVDAKPVSRLNSGMRGQACTDNS
jgi:hypothetical protein